MKDDDRFEVVDFLPSVKRVTIVDRKRGRRFKFLNYEDLHELRDLTEHLVAMMMWNARYSEGGTNVHGNRFEADVSRDKSRADIKDRKGGQVFTILTRQDLDELNQLSKTVRMMMSKKP